MKIHTFEVSSILDKQRFFKIQEKLKTQDKSKWVKEQNGMTYFGLADKGIIIKMYMLFKKGFYSYYILYSVSARRVIENGNYIELFDVKDYDILKEKVNKMLKGKCDVLPKLGECNLHRVDFCINVYLSSQEQVKAYIKTANRANIPAALNRKTYYDKKSKRTKPTKHEMCVTAENNVEVTIYNKFIEMTTQKNYKYPDGEIQKAENIVRMEIRCMEEKIKALKNKYDIETLSQFMRKADKIGKYLFEYYLGKMFGKGQILTLKDALKNVSMSEYKPKNQELLAEFLEASNNERSVAKIVVFYSKDDIKKILKLLANINTNYVTATNETAKLFGDR